MSTLGFGGAAGVGRPFTIQDLFSAVSSSSSSNSNSSTATILNQYLNEDSESVSVVDTYVTSVSSPIGYDMGTWEAAVWT